MSLGLTLIGMRQGTFHPLSFLDQIFVSWIFIKNFQTILEEKIVSNSDAKDSICNRAGLQAVFAV